MSAIALFRSFRAYAPRPPPPPPRPRQPARAVSIGTSGSGIAQVRIPIPNIAAYPAPEAAGASSSLIAATTVNPVGGIGGALPRLRVAWVG